VLLCRVPLDIALDTSNAEVESNLVEFALNESDYIGSLSQESQTSKTTALRADEIKSKAAVIACTDENNEEETVNVCEFLELLCVEGWKAEEPKWTDNWWRHVRVYTAPWFSADNRTVGIDFFYTVDDLIDYLARCGNKRSTKSREKDLKADYTRMSLDAAIQNFAKLQQLPTVKILLAEKGWTEVSKPRQMYIPSWQSRNANEISKSTKGYIENIDYFLDPMVLMKYLSVSLVWNQFRASRNHMSLAGKRHRFTGQETGSVGRCVARTQSSESRESGGGGRRNS
jgi:hypothetical protein